MAQQHEIPEVYFTNSYVFFGWLIPISHLEAENTIKCRPYTKCLMNAF